MSSSKFPQSSRRSVAKALNFLQQWFQNQQSPNRLTKVHRPTLLLEPILTPSIGLDGSEQVPDPVFFTFEQSPELEIIDVKSLSAADAQVELLATSPMPEMPLGQPWGLEATQIEFVPVDFVAEIEPLPIKAPSFTIADDTLDVLPTPDMAQQPAVEIAGDSTIETLDLPSEMPVDDSFPDELISPQEATALPSDDGGTTLPISLMDDSLSMSFTDIYDSGFFTVVDPSGRVTIDFLFDGGAYAGEVAIVSLDGLAGLEPGSDDFIRAAARSALSNSEQGYIVIQDTLEGARFSGKLGEANHNAGDYLGTKTFAMRPGSQFMVMLVPNGTVQQVLEANKLEGSLRPLFSLATANPNDSLHIGQIVDVTGDGNTFALEDQQMGDGNFSDRDYNDVIFQIRGAYGQASSMTEMVNPNADWRNTHLGQALIEYTKPYINPMTPVVPIDLVLEPDASILENLVYDPVLDLPTIEETDIIEPRIDLLEDTFEQPPEPLFEPVDVFEALALLTPLPNNYNFPLEHQPLIGVIDTGFAANNPDLDYSRITLGFDWVDEDYNSLLSPGEGNEHGTHVLGIIAATQGNDIGIEGINDQAPIWAGRAIGSGQWAESLVEYVDYFRESGQPNGVVNLSLDLTQINPDGSVTTRYELTPQERSAIEYARQNGVLLVVAAGNDGGVMSALGQASQEFDNIITVGAAERVNGEFALSKAMDRADYSSYGYGLDIVAPGGTAANPELSTVGDGLGTMAGTSVATAKVTGAVSQVWAANPDLSYRQVIEILKSTATDLKIPNWDGESGAGLLNMAAAVSLAKATQPIQDEEIPASYIPPTWSGEGIVEPSERAAFTAVTWTGQVTSTVGAIVRSGPSQSFHDRVGSRGYGVSVTFDGWTTGEYISYPGLGATDKWYRIAGTNGTQWISGAIINAAPPVNPPPVNPPTGYYPELGSLTNSQWNEYTKDNTRFDVGWPDYRDERHLTPLSIRNIYTDLSNTIFGRRVPVTAGYLLDPGYRAGIGIWHSGLDMSAPAGTPVKVPVGGTIVRGIQETRGNHFIGVRGDDGKLWIYGHLGTVAVPGGRIEAGQTIGTIGSANHLHLELQAGPNYRQSQSSKLDTVQNATLNPIKAYWELRNRNAPPSAQPLPPTGRRIYVVKPGDSLWAIAQRELGNGNRWREITNENGSPLTSTTIFPGQRLSLPITQQSGTGIPINPPPTPTPGTGNITYVNFSGTVGPQVGVNLRHSPRFADRSNRNEPYGKRLEFDAWTYGETGTDMWTGKADARWFKVKGTNFWVPSAYIWGNPPTNSGNNPGNSNPGIGGQFYNKDVPPDDGQQIKYLTNKANEGYASDKPWDFDFPKKAWLDVVKGSLSTLANTWDAWGWDDAARLLRHFLGNHGEMWQANSSSSVSVDELIRESSDFRRILFDNAISDAVRRSKTYVLSGYSGGNLYQQWGKTVGHFDLISDAGNWLAALGGFGYRYSASFKQVSSNTISVDVKFHVSDVYDFSNNSSQGWILEAINALHKAGYAKNFALFGESREYTWLYSINDGFLDSIGGVWEDTYIS